MPSDGKRRRSRVSNVAGDQRKIIDDVYSFRAFGAVIYAHRPSNERGCSPAIDHRRLVDLLGREPSELRDAVGRVLEHRLPELVEACGVRSDVFAIDEAILNQQVNHAVKESDVRARL